MKKLKLEDFSISTHFPGNSVDSQLEKPLFVSIVNIGKGIKMPHELHLAKVNFIATRIQLNSPQTESAHIKFQGRPGIFILANEAIYTFVSLDFNPDWKNTEEAKKRGGWIFLKLRIRGFIGDNGGMSIVGGDKVIGTVFSLPISSEDVEIFEIEKFM